MREFLMRVQFQTTYADFLEANLGRVALQRLGGKPAIAWSRIAAWLIMLLGISMLILARASAVPARNKPDPHIILPLGGVLTIRFLNASAYSFLFCVLYAMRLVQTAVKRPRPGWLGPAKGQRWIALLIYIVMTAFVVLVLRVMNIDSYSDSPRSPSGYEILLSAAPTLVLVGMLAVFGSTYRRFDVRRRWEAQEFLHRPYTLAADDAGIALEEAKSTTRYQWDYFPGFRETVNTLLLYVSAYGFVIVPKRAFASAEDLETFKAFLLSHIKTGTLLPTASSGFPVSLLPPPLPPKARLASDMHNPLSS